MIAHPDPEVGRTRVSDARLVFLGTVIVHAMSTGCIAADADRAAAAICAKPGSICSSSPPLNVNLPVLSGVLQPCATLTANPGSWQPGGLEYTYRWLRCSSPDTSTCIELDATAETFVIPEDFVGSFLGLRVTAAHGPGSATAEAIGVARSLVALPAAPSGGIALLEGFDALPSLSPAGHGGARTFDEASGTLTFIEGRSGRALSFSGSLRKALASPAPNVSLRFAFRGIPSDGPFLLLEAGTSYAVALTTVGGRIVLDRDGVTAPPVQLAGTFSAWNLLELRATASSAELRVNGKSVVLTGSPFAADFRQLSMFGGFAFDDFALGYTEEFLGDGRVLPLVPAAVRSFEGAQGQAAFVVGGLGSLAEAWRVALPEEFDSTWLEQTTAEASSRVVFGLSPADSAANALRVVTQLGSLPPAMQAKVRFKIGGFEAVTTADYASTRLHFWMAPASLGTQSICALRDASISWGEATDLSGGNPRLFSVYAEGNFPK